jgi:hypothetical protein
MTNNQIVVVNVYQDHWMLLYMSVFHLNSAINKLTKMTLMALKVTLENNLK